MKSILQKEKECYYCKTTLNLEEHHCLYGTANRRIAERFGLKVWLCSEHHRGRNTQPHQDGPARPWRVASKRRTAAHRRLV